MERTNLVTFNELDADLEYGAINEDLWSPDAAEDMIWMMSEADWQELEKVWHQRSDRWKLLCIAILGLGSSNPNQIYLKQALLSENFEIVSAAIGALNILIEKKPEEIIVDPETALLLQNLPIKYTESQIPKRTLEEIKLLLEHVRKS
jgi:hypothetical protein